jgi:hypothetical protein
MQSVSLAQVGRRDWTDGLAQTAFGLLPVLQQPCSFLKSFLPLPLPAISLNGQRLAFGSSLHFPSIFLARYVKLYQFIFFDIVKYIF